MAQQITHFIIRIRQQLQTYWSSLVEEARHCSDCQAVVSPWDTVCPDCGMAHPARVTIPPVVYAVVGIGLVVAVVVVQWL